MIWPTRRNRAGRAPRSVATLTYPTGARRWRSWQLASLLLDRRSWVPHGQWYAIVAAASALSGALSAALGRRWQWGAIPVAVTGVTLPLATSVGPLATLRSGPLHLAALAILRPARAPEYLRRSHRRRIEATGLPFVGLTPEAGGRRWVGGSSWSRHRRGRRGVTVGVRLTHDLGHGRVVKIETSDHEPERALGALWDRLGGRCEDEGRPVGEPDEITLTVDGEALRFTARRCGSTWGAHARVGNVSISVLASGVEPDELRVERVADLGPYLERDLPPV